MFSFFTKKSGSTSGRFDFIEVDMHNHLLPGIDDGSPDPEASLRLVEGMMELGYKQFICTPHVISDIHPNNPATITAAHQLFREKIESAGLDCSTRFSAEYMINFDFDEIVASKELLPFGKRKHVLIEMSYAVESPNLKEAIFDLLTKGFDPVLAHPERYLYYHQQFNKYEDIVAAGCDLQINLLSLIGYYGKPAKSMAEKLIERGLISWVGTDLHHDRHLAALNALASNTKALKVIDKIRDLKNPSLAI